MPAARATVAPNVATWNAYYRNSHANMEKGVRAIINSGADVIGFQELSEDSDQRFVTALLKRLDWTVTKRNTAVTVAVGPRYDLVRETAIDVFRSGVKWEPGTGGNDSILKILMKVELKHKRTGERSFVFNNHIVPAIERNGRLITPRPPKGGTSRITVYRAQMAAIVREVKAVAATGCPVAVTGDFNIAWGTPAAADMESRLDDARLVCTWETQPDVDTHGDRTIDYVWYTNCRCVGQRLPGKFGSDHLSVVADLEPNVGDYVVDPAKVQTFLWGIADRDVTVDGALVKAGSKVKQREAGFPIDTGVDIIHIRDPRDGKTYAWLVTEAGFRYRMDYLKAA